MNKRLVLLILSICAFVVMADNWVVSPILPSISKDIGVSEARAALIISAYMLPFGLFQLVFGYLGDKFGRVRVISITMIFFTIGTGLCAIATGLSDLSVYRALTGIFAGSVMPISFALIADTFPMQERHSAIGTLLGVAFVGQGLSTIIGGSIAHFISWRGVFAVYALLAVLPTIMLLLVSRKLPVIINKESRLLKPLFGLLKESESRSLYLVVLLEGIFIMGSFSFLGGFIKNAYNFNNLYIGYVMSVFGIMAIIAGRLASKIASGIGYKRTIEIGFASAAVANVIYVISGTNLPLLIIGIGLSGFGLMLAHSTLLTIATEFASRARGVAMSFVAFCFMCGGSIGTVIGSEIIERSGFVRLFDYYAIGLTILFIAAFFMFKRYKESVAH